MKRTSDKTKKQALARLVCCKDCFWANLIQYGSQDPLLAECRKKPQLFNERFPYEVEVARVMRLCDMHDHQDEAEKSVQQRVKVRRYLDRPNAA